MAHGTLGTAPQGKPREPHCRQEIEKLGFPIQRQAAALEYLGIRYEPWASRRVRFKLERLDGVHADDTDLPMSREILEILGQSSRSSVHPRILDIKWRAVSRDIGSVVLRASRVGA